MTTAQKLCAVIPVKDSGQAKQRLAGILSSAQRRELALAMLEDVLATLASVPELAEILIVTVDPYASEIAARYRAAVSALGARDGHTGAIAAAARRLAADGCAMLALPGDVPLIETDDVRRIMAAHDGTPSFTIVPARDEQGSNAVLCSPADIVPMRFGENSFFPHLAAARACGIAPNVMRLPRIALDIDTPDDLAALLAAPAGTRARTLLDRWYIGLDDRIMA